MYHLNPENYLTALLCMATMPAMLMMGTVMVRAIIRGDIQIRT